MAYSTTAGRSIFEMCSSASTSACVPRRPCPCALQREVELVDERQARHRQAHALRFLQRDPHVLDEVLDDEARLELPLNTRGARFSSVQHPAAPLRIDCSIDSGSSSAR